MHKKQGENVVMSTPKKNSLWISITILLLLGITMTILFCNKNHKTEFITATEAPKDISALISEYENKMKSTEQTSESAVKLEENELTQQQHATVSSAEGESAKKELPVGNLTPSKEPVPQKYTEQKTEGLSFHLLKAYQSKKLLYKDVEKVDFWNEPHEADGTLHKHTYVFIELTIKNLENKPKEIYLNDTSLNFEGDVMMRQEMRYRHEGGDINDKGYFKDVLSAGEAKTYTLGFIIEDSYMGRSLILRHNPLGRLYDDSIRQYEIFPEKVG